MLKKGITGFWHIDDPPLGHVSSESIKKIIQALWLSRQVTSLKKEAPGISNNYHTLHISKYSFEMDILINSTQPFYCGVSKDHSWMNLEFIEVPEKIRAVIDPEFEYLSPDFLNQPLQRDLLTELAQVELDQIKYWKSRTIGEVIFNGYD